MPEQQPLALYGRGPNWLYAAIAIQALPAPFYQFDVRLGWIKIPTLEIGALIADSPLQAHVQSIPYGRLITFQLVDAYLDIDAATTWRVPFVGTEEGIILNGKLPLWLWCALARAYRGRWVALFQPQVQGAVVVATRDAVPAVGTCLPFTP